MEKLERYRGELTLEQLIVARKKVMENAKELYEEATLLYVNNKFSRAYFLLSIANEELGKYFLITSTIVDLAAGSVDWKCFWKSVRNHKEKTGAVENIENILVSTEENFTPPLKIRECIPLMEEIKMASLYSDMFQHNFFLPNEIISPEIVSQYYNLTKRRMSFFTSVMFVSDEALRSIKKEDVLKFREKLNDMINKSNSV